MSAARKTGIEMAVEDRKERKEMVGGLVDTFYHTLDPKKRLTIPSEWRDAMGMEVGENKIKIISHLPMV